MRFVNATTSPRRAVPDHVWGLPLKERLRWARKSAGLSHDRLVAAMERSNRGHVIKIEHGDHVPKDDLRAAWADATNVPRELFEVTECVDPTTLITDGVREIVREELAEAHEDAA